MVGDVRYWATNVPGLVGDGGPATLANLYLPQAVAIASNGDIVIADSQNHR